MTPKNIHKIFIPSKIFIFLKIPKNIEIQNFEIKKMTRTYVCMKISEYPPPPPGGMEVNTFKPNILFMTLANSTSAKVLKSDSSDCRRQNIYEKHTYTPIRYSLFL